MSEEPDSSERSRREPSALDTTGEAAVFEPRDWIRYCADRSGRSIPELPALGVQLLLRSQFEAALERFGAERDDFTQAGHPFAVVSSGSVEFVLAWSAKGSGAAGGLEELIELGVEKLIVIGGAGSMTDELHIGDVVIASAALRDDGMSAHYEPPSRFSYPSETLTRRLEAEALSSGLHVTRAPVWSITAYFRQTPTRLERFRQDGCVAVCNEAAAAFSIGRYRDVDVAAMFVIGDSIASGRFDVPHEPEVSVAQTMLDAAINTLGGS
jgi:nucleoside phosphorylase